MIQSLRHNLLLLLLLSGAAACGHISSITQKTGSFQGKHCGKQPLDVHGFVERYMSASKEIQGELWTELEFYDCAAKGLVFVNGSEFRYDINASGAGILWQQKNKSEVKKYYFCDSQCRKSARWPFGEQLHNKIAGEHPELQ
jgi:hypothetical protein